MLTHMSAHGDGVRLCGSVLDSSDYPSYVVEEGLRGGLRRRVSALKVSQMLYWSSLGLQARGT